MEDNEKTFETYFSGMMHSARADNFHSALKANPELQERYDEFIAIKKATHSIERDNLRQLLNGVEIENTEPTDKENSASSATIIPLLKRVAGIAAIFIIGFLGYQMMTSTSVDTLYAQNFEMYQIQNSRGENTPSPEYPAGLNTPELKLLYSTIKMEENEMKEAIRLLSEISDDTSLRDQKYWYLALANLKTRNTAEAIKHLDHLRSISNYKKPEIEEILSAIRK